MQTPDRQSIRSHRPMRCSTRKASAALACCILAFQLVAIAADPAPLPEASGAPRMKQLFATLHHDLHKGDEVLKEAIAIAEAHPTEVETLCLLSMLQCLLNRVEDARATYERARRLNPNSAHVYVALSVICSQTSDPRFGGPDRAGMAKALERAVELAPKYCDAWFNLAVLYWLRTPPNREAARAAYKKAVDLGAERDSGLEKSIDWRP